MYDILQGCRLSHFLTGLSQKEGVSQVEPVLSHFDLKLSHYRPLDFYPIFYEANNTKVDLKLKSLTQQKSIAEIFGPNEEEDGRAKKRKSNESQILS